MVRRALTLLCLGLLTVFMTSCGQTYKLLSITVTPGTLDASGNSSIYLIGDAAYQQLTVTAKYSNTKTQDVTVKSTYQVGSSNMDSYIGNANCTVPNCVAPLTALVVNRSGMASLPGAACTVDTESTNSPTNSAWSYGLVPYPVTVTYTEDGVTVTAKLDVNAVNTPACFDGTKLKPWTGFPGNSVYGF